MTVQEALRMGGLPTKEVERLLCAILNQNTAWIFGHGAARLSLRQRMAFHRCVAKMQKGQPMEYALGRAAFLGRSFFVDKRVLIPRPCTEILTREAIALLKAKTPFHYIIDLDEGIAGVIALRTASAKLVVDACTGSGCIGISIAAEVPGIRVLLSDIDTKALSVARKNARLHGCGAAVRCVHADGIPKESIDTPYVLVSNPPYVPQEAWVQDSVRLWEPSRAVFAGRDGLDVLEPMITAAASDARCCAIAVECRSEQAERIMSLFL